MQSRALNWLLAGFLALAAPAAALAGAVAESLKGEVQVDGAPAAQGQRLAAQAAVSTGPGGQLFLRFDDGMQIVIGENSLLRIVDFRYSDSGVADRAVFELLRGSARVVTGKVALANPKQFFFRTPQTQLMVDRPSDFTVALVNPAYIAVHSGALLSSNGWGTVSLAAGSTTSVAASGAAPAAISASSLPAGAAGPMSNLSLAAVSAPVGTAATGVAATAAGIGTAFVAPVVVGAAVVAGVAAAANANDGGSQPAATPQH
jgi:hypothetical protein